MNKSFTYRADGLPFTVIESIQRYVDFGTPPSQFLEAVICNNLVMSVARADERNLQLLPAIVTYLYNEVPAMCWGSREKYQRWIQGGNVTVGAVGLRRQMETSN